MCVCACVCVCVWVARKDARVPLGEKMIEHAITIEEEMPTDGLPGEHLREPQEIVRPHLVVGNRSQGRPKWDRLIGLLSPAPVSICGENVDVNRIAVEELET